MIVGTGNGLLCAVDVNDKSLRTIAETGFGIDGLQGDGYGNYFVSDWAGKTAFVKSNGEVNVLMNTTESKINSADIEYIPDKKLLLTPTFFDNRVIAYAVD